MNIMQNTLFSIILPTYNRAYILNETIKSVISQIYKEWELIIVDDGSTDNTKEIVLSFLDKRIIYIYQENQERSVARNNGIDNAKGEYICFLDSDDKYCENHLQTLFTEIEKHNKPTMFFTNPFYLENGKITEAKVKSYENDSLDYFIVNSVIPDRVCINKEIFSEFNFDKRFNIGEDTLLWVQIANKYPVVHIEEATIVYNISDENSVNIKNNCYVGRLNSLTYLYNNDDIRHKLSAEVKKDSISNTYLGIAKHYEFKRKFFKMLYYIFISFVKKLKSDKNKHKLYMIYSYIFNK